MGSGGRVLVEGALRGRGVGGLGVGGVGDVCGVAGGSGGAVR